VTFRALVLGGGGMLGGAVVRQGRRLGSAVLGLDRTQADVTDPAALAAWVGRFQPEVIFNCAAFTRVDDCETEEAAATAVNGDGAGFAAAAARAAGAVLVHVSTDYVFDGTARSPYPVDAPTAPVSAYGRSKLAGERHALAYERAAVVRTSWLFGPGGPNFVRTMAGFVSAGRRELRVVGDQVGCPTYTPFLARALWDLAARQRGAPAADFGVYHYANREPISWCGFTREIVRELDPTVTVTEVTTAEFPRPAVRPAYSVLAVDRLEALLGRRVETWSSGLAYYLDLYRQGDFR
jgi:dTDP-4-dehydrorhamnose reductase